MVIIGLHREGRLREDSAAQPAKRAPASIHRGDWVWVRLLRTEAAGGSKHTKWRLCAELKTFSLINIELWRLLEHSGSSLSHFLTQADAVETNGPEQASHLRLYLRSFCCLSIYKLWPSSKERRLLLPIDHPGTSDIHSEEWRSWAWPSYVSFPTEADWP